MKLISILVIILIIMLGVGIYAAVIEEKENKIFMQEHHCALNRDIEGIIKTYACDGGTEIVR
jgi:hypothetical protein